MANGMDCRVKPGNDALLVFITKNTALGFVAGQDFPNFFDELSFGHLKLRLGLLLPILVAVLD